MYLEQYWPECPSGSAAWIDNVRLMSAYEDCALAIRRIFKGHHGLNLLDIGTGPTLAPLLGVSSELRSATLTDYSEENRLAVLSIPVSYWRHYVPLLTRAYVDPAENIDEILNKLDKLRHQTQVLHVDLFRPQPLSIPTHEFHVVSMHFVADSLTHEQHVYFELLGRVCDLIAGGSVLVLSAIIDAEHWDVGPIRYTSPCVKDVQILDFLDRMRFRIEQVTKSTRLQGQTYDGTWAVITAQR